MDRHITLHKDRWLDGQLYIDVEGLEAWHYVGHVVERVRQHPRVRTIQLRNPGWMERLLVRKIYYKNLREQKGLTSIII